MTQNTTTTVDIQSPATEALFSAEGLAAKLAVLGEHGAALLTPEAEAAVGALDRTQHFAPELAAALLR
ncbi:MAG: hypothetical protein AAGC57_21275, partial [Pseudomonadota bacterium]